jgi:predicted nucleic acid-binding protein
LIPPNASRAGSDERLPSTSSSGCPWHPGDDPADGSLVGKNSDPALPAFFDTNILICSDDGDSPQKQRMALELFRAHAERGSAVVSIQVVQEYFVAASKKLRLSVGAARAKVEMISLAARVIRPSAEDVLSAIDLHSMHKVSYWDALIRRRRGEPERIRFTPRTCSPGLWRAAGVDYDGHRDATDGAPGMGGTAPTSECDNSGQAPAPHWPPPKAPAWRGRPGGGVVREVFERLNAQRAGRLNRQRRRPILPNSASAH